MSCSDVQTIQAGDGSNLNFSFDFPYIFKSEIHVYFWNVTTKEWDEKLTTDGTHPWRITDANPTIVEFTGEAPPAPTEPTVPNEETQDNVRIRRITNIDDIRALFNPGSAIRSDDLNNNYEQLRFAIQESNCQDVPEEIKEYLEEYYWDRFDNTIYEDDDWRSDDATIATTAALDARFQDEVAETITSAETWPDDDNTVATTAAIDNRIDTAITNDIGTDGTGITVTDDGDGTITLGLGASSIDLDRITADDIITLAEQNAGPTTSNDSIFTSSAASKRFDTIVQTDTPSGDDYETGKTWLQNNDDLTLSVWNGSAWTAVTSGGTFINQPKVIYVDSGAGDDNNDGHRISRPKLTIRAALSDINADESGDGTIISVAPGIYAETLPLDIEKNDIAIIGQSLRTCIIHPAIPEDDQATYDVDTPHAQELETMFRVNSGSYFQNLTLTGLKASGTRGDTGSLYEDATHGLPPNQGWNFAFFPDADIKKSPYVQNCTNFSDSQINNVDFTPHTPSEGAAGDLDSAPTGGGILVDGSVPHDDSPLRSIVCDSYTHTALDGPGIFVTNNGYLQATSSYAFFNHAHITCINGGQANLAASTSDFGRFGLIADGQSTTAIFTSNVDGAATDGDTTFNINAPTAGASWFGSDTRPANNMLVTVNSVTYPVLSATARTDSEGNDGWVVTISRPNSEDRSQNDGIDGDIADDASVEFFLRSMIASSGHTMEYVGSGTNYTALPENGGVPDEDNQVVERNNGKVWAATTDHKGKFKVGDFFEVDQQAGTLTVGTGSFSADLSNLEVNVSGDAEVGSDLDLGDNEITSSSGNLNLNASSDIDVNTNKIINLTDPTADQDAATKVYVDDNTIASVLDDASPQLGGNLDVNDFEILSTDNGDVTINPNGTGNIVLDADVGIGTSSPEERLHVGGDVKIGFATPNDEGRTLIFDANRSASSSPIGNIKFDWNGTDVAQIRGMTGGDTTNKDDGHLVFYTSASAGSLVERVRIDRIGNVGIGESSPAHELHVSDASTPEIVVEDTTNNCKAYLGSSDTNGRIGTLSDHDFAFRTNDTERARIDTSGRLLVGTSSNIGSGADNRDTIIGVSASGAGLLLGRNDTSTAEGNNLGKIQFWGNDANGTYEQCASIQAQADSAHGTGDKPTRLVFSTTADDASSVTERMRIDSSGNVKIGTGSTVTADTNADDFVIDKGAADTGLSILSTSTGRIYFGDAGDHEAGSIRYVHSGNTMRFETAGSERMRLNNRGELLLGTTDAIADTNDSAIHLKDPSGGNIYFLRDDSSVAAGNDLGNLRFYSNDGGSNVECARISVEADGSHSGSSRPGRIIFSTVDSGTTTLSEQARLTNGGEFIVGKTISGVADRGGELRDGNSDYAVVATANGHIPLIVNRNTDDGGLVRFRQANTDEGTISVSGGTITYGEFCGSHWGRLEDNSKPEILRGTILETVNKAIEWKVVEFEVNGEQKRQAYNGSEENGASVTVEYEGVSYTGTVADEEPDSENLNKHVCVKVSDTAASKAVFGVFLRWDTDEEEGIIGAWNDMHIASLGNYFIRIKSGQTPEIGDLIESDGTGCGVVQSDDIIRSKTVAKVTSTTSHQVYADGSFLVTCVLYSG
jgi:hypothetical protein